MKNYGEISFLLIYNLPILESILAQEMAFQSSYLWCLSILLCVCLAKKEGGEESSSVTENKQLSLSWDWNMKILSRGINYFKI